MKKRYYIAYGSNLDVEQMKFRTPDAKLVGTAILYGWRLLFKTHATIEECVGKNTPVAVWEISERDEQNLDRYEGFPFYYFKKELEIEVFPMDGGELQVLTAMVYIMTTGRELQAPMDSYYRILENGYKLFDFPIHILEQALADSIGREAAIAKLEKCTLNRPKKTVKAHKSDSCPTVPTDNECKEILDLLGKMQKKGGQSKAHCPRCGILPPRGLLALSRRADILICDDCGTTEALEDAGMAERLPLAEWFAIIEALKIEEGWKS